MICCQGWILRKAQALTQKMTANRWGRAFVQDLTVSPLRMGGMILAVAVLTNGIVLISLGRSLSGWGIAFRGMLLFLGLIGSASTSPLSSVRQGSHALRALDRWLKKGAPPCTVSKEE